MSIFRPWAFWRRLQYIVGFGVFWSAIIAVFYFGYFYTPASCFDGILNGNEAGVDCGGGCTLICEFAVEPPQVVWAESFKIRDGQYNSVAYIENKNAEAGSPALTYTFRLFDGEDLIAERSGTTVLPPNSVYPVFEGRMETLDDRSPTRTTIEINPTKMWLPAAIGRNQFRTLDWDLLSTDSRPRLNVRLENTELTEARDVEVVATIFNQAGNPITASQSFIDKFDPRSTQDIVFTWPIPIAKTVRSCEVPSDIMLILDRSGSMAADGGDPPEPLESAKQAAKSFVKLVHKQDTMGYLSYATTPSNPIEQTLTPDIEAVVNAIQSTKMGEDGVQYTNMGDAFAVALSELTGVRHRDNARKVIIFLTDGDVTRPVNPETGLADREYAATYALDMAKKAKDSDVTIYTIGFGDFFGGANDSIERDVTLIKDLASDPNMYFEAPTIRQLEAVYKEIAIHICEVGPARIDIIPKTDTNFAPLR
ncbi:MAG: VWA domain-containing protein [Candidatus Nomurabacteria bacterium]|nr:VWA domain-containing protein [Candidatus Nomurabacteria bacterium]USN88171.1 MAG: VWA domain-containing protein [Candidatus Nomurabacteria bacterium]